jgi:hypothetical protein
MALSEFHSATSKEPPMIRTALALAALLLAACAAEDAVSDDARDLAQLTSRPLAQRALRWECTPSVLHVCTSEGCKRTPATVSVRLDLEKNTYARCDEAGCDSYPMTFSKSGIFTIVNLPNNGSTFLKVVNDGSEYLEVQSLILAVFQSFGTCKATP